MILMPYDIFMSYTHAKDEFGAVTTFIKHLEHELYKKSGVIITVFQDKRDIRPGDEWETFISEQLKSAKMLLILLSPTWITSKECAKEYEQFLDSMNQAQARKKIIALLWDQLKAARLDDAQKSLLSKIEKYQKLDWVSHQYDNFTTPEQQAAMGELATTLVEELNKIEAPLPAALPQ
jgi:hypothetical protein